MSAPEAWRRPWLDIERFIRAVVADRLEAGASDVTDRVLAGLIVKRRKIEQDGWFN
jgi:hypothetical protein